MRQALLWYANDIQLKPDSTLTQDIEKWVIRLAAGGGTFYAGDFKSLYQLPSAPDISDSDCGTASHYNLYPGHYSDKMVSAALTEIALARLDDAGCIITSVIVSQRNQGLSSFSLSAILRRFDVFPEGKLHEMLFWSDQLSKTHLRVRKNGGPAGSARD